MRFSSATIRKERGDSLERTRINKIDIFFIAVVFHNGDAERISYTTKKCQWFKENSEESIQILKECPKIPPKKKFRFELTYAPNPALINFTYLTISADNSGIRNAE